MSAFAGKVWRHIPAGKEPLHLGALLKFSQGRWNRRGEYAALYTACTAEGARAEWRKMMSKAGSAVGPRELVSLLISVSPVCDLTTLDAYNDLTARAGVAPHPKFLVDLDAVPHSHCHTIADQVRAEGFPALLVPSAAALGEQNLIVYFDVVAPKHLELDNGPDRLPL